MNRSLINRTELALQVQRRAAKINRAGQTLVKAPDITKAAAQTPSKLTRLKLS